MTYCSRDEYCSRNNQDGMFDMKVYDVTEIDAVSSMPLDDFKDIITDRVEVENVSKENKSGIDKEICTKSILMTMMDLNSLCATQFLQSPAIHMSIDEKWKAYGKWFRLAGWFHFLFVCCLTWYSVERAQHNPNNLEPDSTKSAYDVNAEPNFKSKLFEDAFVTAFGVISLVVAFLVIAQEGTRMWRKKMPWTLFSIQNPYNNGSFRGIFLFWAVLLVLDFIFAATFKTYENYLLIVAVILGWFNCIFFLKVSRHFSFFTVLIQRVLIADVLKFSFILVIELMAFATALYMAVQGSDVISDDEYSDFGRVMFSCFKLMVGLGEVAVLYDTRQPPMTIVIFSLFVIMTTILMLNALIAMMSKTCTELVEVVGDVNVRDRHWKLQQLSVILFIESILPNELVCRVGKPENVKRYNHYHKNRRETKRYLYKIQALQQSDIEDIEPKKYLMDKLYQVLMKGGKVSHNKQNRMIRTKTKTFRSKTPKTPRNATLDIYHQGNSEVTLQRIQ